jgi:NADH-quinone oxidoreductase subunit A
LSPDLHSYFPLAVVFLVAGLLAAALVLLASVLGPKRPSAVKSSPYECGSEPVGDARDRFGVKFYMVALLFIVFDVEVVFLYPWAVLFTELGWGGLWAMTIFVATLAVGLFYVWKKGALEWE